MRRLFHVAPRNQRQSILAHGIDWRQAKARSLGGCSNPGNYVFVAESDAIALATKSERVWGGGKDIWAVQLDPDGLVPDGRYEEGAAWRCVTPIPVSQIELVREGVDNPNPTERFYVEMPRRSKRRVLPWRRLLARA